MIGKGKAWLSQIGLLILVVITLIFYRGRKNIKQRSSHYAVKIDKYPNAHKYSVIGEESGVNKVNSSRVEVEPLFWMNGNCSYPTTHVIEAGDSGIGKKLDKRRRNKMKFCFKTDDPQWKLVGVCKENSTSNFWPLKPLSPPFAQTYHLNEELKIFACTSPFYPQQNVWEYIFDESDSFQRRMVSSDLELVHVALNSPHWHRMVAVAHPFIRLYNTWNVMFNKQTTIKIVETYLKQFKFNNTTMLSRNNDQYSHWIRFEAFVARLSRMLNDSNNIPFQLIPIYDLCGLCMRQYDYILKLETLKAEAPHVMMKMGLKPNKYEFLKGKNINADNFDHLQKQVIGTFEKLSGDVVANLQNYYRKDFLIFKYPGMLIGDQIDKKDAQNVDGDEQNDQNGTMAETTDEEVEKYLTQIKNDLRVTD